MCDSLLNTKIWRQRKWKSYRYTTEGIVNIFKDDIKRCELLQQIISVLINLVSAPWIIILLLYYNYYCINLFKLYTFQGTLKQITVENLEKYVIKDVS